MTTERSRHIPVAVQRQLRNDARDRCCVCGRLLPFDEIGTDIEAGILHQHHVIYFSDGGENIEENLVLVCPSCHSKIHTYPERYPRETLREAKRHWNSMKNLVEPVLTFQSDIGAPPVDGSRRQLKFHVAAVNLDYLLLTPELVEVKALARFVATWIMHPLVAYARLAPFNYMFGQAQLAQMALAKKSSPNVRLDWEQTVCDIELGEDDALLALVDFQWVAARPRAKYTRKARVTLSRHKTPRYLDLHFVSADGEHHVSYNNRGSLAHPPWARLHVDISTGFGPQVITVGERSTGRYDVLVHNFSGESRLVGSRASVVVELPDGHHQFDCPTSGDGNVWKVCSIDTSAGSIEPIGMITSDSRIRRSGGHAQYDFMEMRRRRRCLLTDREAASRNRPVPVKCPHCDMILSQRERLGESCPVCNHTLR